MKEGLSKFLLKKKIFSLIMVVSIILGMLPTTASALKPGLQISDIDADDVTEIPEYLENGEIWTDKSVVPDDSNPGEFTITLSAAGQGYQKEQPNKVDVVLVLDTSFSMRDNGTRLADMKTAAESAVETLLGPGLDNRVAIVTFNNKVQLELGFTTDAEALKAKISGLITASGTNTQNAFFVAQKTLQTRSQPNQRKPVIILISDGKPSYYHTSLTDHGTNENPKNRKGDGDDTKTTGDYVWWTVKQAMEAKTKISGLEIYTIGIGVENNALAKATLQPDEENTRDFWPETFNHKYWTKCVLAGENGIEDALKEIVNIVLSEQPHSKASDNEYSDIVIEDVLGEDFEVVGPLPTGLVKTGDTIIWTIDGDDFAKKTLGPGSTSLSADNILTITFKVKISNSATAIGTYYTNDSAQAVFNVSEDNPFYDGSNKKDQNGDVTETLNNKGWLTIEQLDDPEVTLTIKKQFTAPLPEDVTETFSFNIYRDEVNAGNLLETVSITVPDESNSGEAQAIVTINDLKWSDFYQTGEVTLCVKEEEGDSEYWAYDDNIQTVEVTPDKLTGEVTFINTYTPPGTINVTKTWSTGTDKNIDWPVDVTSITVQLWEEAPVEEPTLQTLQMFMMDDTDGIEGEDKDGIEGEDKDGIEDEGEGLGGDEDEGEGLGGDEGEGLGGDEGEGLGGNEGEGLGGDEGIEGEDGTKGDDGDDGEETFTHNVQLLFAYSETQPNREPIDELVLTRENPSGSFKEFEKKDGYRYFINEVEVEGYITEMSATKGDIFSDGEIKFDEDNSAAITITNTGNAPAISITKEVVDGSTKTLSGGKATFIYELVVTNTGNTTLENVEVEDVMNGPSGATFEYSDNTSTFVIGKMEPGDSESITYSVIVDKAGEYTNKATATCNECDPVSVTATATVNSEYVPPVTPPVTPPSGGGGGYTPSQGTVKVNYVDVNGNALADGDELTGMVGTDYSTSAKTIDGYTLTAVPENAEGTFVNGVIMVTYVYKAEETEIEIEEEEIPEGTPEEPIIDEEIPQGGEILPQTGLPIATLPELFGGALIALGLYFGRKAKEDEE